MITVFNMKWILIFLLLIKLSISCKGEKITDEVIIFYKNNLSVIQGLNLEKKHKNRVVVKVPGNKTINQFINELKRIPDITYVIPNYKISTQLIPNDSFYDAQWYLRNISMDKAWDMSTGFPDIYVAVLDSGIDINHQDILKNIWVNEGELRNIDADNNGIDDGCEDNIDNDSNGYIDDCFGFNAIVGYGSAFDDFGHGTHVSGIIGAVGNNNIGVAGINWQIKIVPCKFLDSSGNGDLFGLLTCLEYVKNLIENKNLNIVVVNGSYGYEGDDSLLSVDCSLEPRTEKCLINSINALFVVSAGNGGLDLIGDNNDSSVFLPCNYSTVLSNVLCVGAVDNKDNKSSYSNYGVKTVNLFAPGGEIPSSDCSNGILSTYLGNQYACQVGTSQSAPVVSGIAGLVSTVKLLTTSDLKKLLLSTGDNVLSLSGFSQTCNRINGYNALIGLSEPKICFNKMLVVENNEYSYSFGLLKGGEIKTETFEIISSGSSPLNVYRIYLQNGKYFKIIDDNCSGKSFNFLEKCSFNVSFQPFDKNSFEDFLFVETNSSYGTIQIKFTGQASTIAVSESLKDSGGGGCVYGSDNNQIIYLIILVILIILKKVINNRILFRTLF